jgi:hypothetical protein
LELQPSPFEGVRCVDCDAVYEQAAQAGADPRSQACPDCGGTTWLAVEIPLPETPAVATA